MSLFSSPVPHNIGEGKKRLQLLSENLQEVGAVGWAYFGHLLKYAQGQRLTHAVAISRRDITLAYAVMLPKYAPPPKFARYGRCVAMRVTGSQRFLYVRAPPVNVYESNETALCLPVPYPTPVGHDISAQVLRRFLCARVQGRPGTVYGVFQLFVAWNRALTTLAY